MANKSEKPVVTQGVEYLSAANRQIALSVEAFSSLEILKPSDSFLFGLIRSLQALCDYVLKTLQDAEGTRRSVKAKALSPEVSKD